MVTAAITISQSGISGSPGVSRDDLELGATVILTNNNNTGVTTWLWEFISIPPGSSSFLTTPYGQSASFSPDKRGSYLIKLTVSDGIEEDSSQIIAAIKTDFLKIRIPALEETIDFSFTHGWSGALYDAFMTIDSYAGGSLKIDGSNSPVANIDFNDKRIINLHDPVQTNDAVNKKYVDESLAFGDVEGSFKDGFEVVGIGSKQISGTPEDGFVLVFNEGLDHLEWDNKEVNYTNSDPSVITVGGINQGTTFLNTTFSEFMNMLLYPELFPTLTNPSSTFVISPSGLREIGEIISEISISASFNRGSISPPYGTSGYRSGLPNEYFYTGIGLSNNPSTLLTDSQSVFNYEVLDGTQNWRGWVGYDEGEQPLSSKGNDYSSPLPAGTTSSITRSIIGVYPFFATTQNITIMTKQSLVSSYLALQTNMVMESGSNKQSIEFPSSWGSVQQISQYNTLSGQWDIIDTSTFTESSITKEINGYTINYKKLTHNGSLIGNRSLRWRVE